MPAVSPYNTVLPFGRAAPSFIPESAIEDRERVRAYETYDDIFNNVPEIFAAVLKQESGEEVFRRLVPAARTVIEATNRYLGVGLHWLAEPPAPTSGVDPAAGSGAAAVADESINATMTALNVLFKRERFGSTFMSLKRWMLIRGDALLHITADMAKPEGSRLSIREINPGTYFVVRDPADAERVLGCYIVNIISDDAGDDIAARLEYQRITDTDRSAEFNNAPLGTVFVRLTFWEVDGWDGRESAEDLAPVDTPTRFNSDRFALLLTGTTLPAGVAAIPVYHFRNHSRGGEVFGTSEVQGIETLLCGVNQTMTDEEVTIAFQGLGIYWTDSGKARDDSGQVIPWQIAPATMLELQPGRQVGRLEGVHSITPSQDHIKALKDEMQETTGTPEIAIGAVDVTVAESGVSRAIQFAPVMAKNAEKEEEIRAVLDNLLFDLLTGWMPAVEGYTDNGVRVTAQFGPALPVNPTEVVTLATSIVTAKIASAKWARGYLTEQLGIQFPANEGDIVTQEAAAALDATGARLDAAVAGGGGADGNANPGAA